MDWVIASSMELLLEPNGEHPATKTFKKALYEEGIPLTAFWVDGGHLRRHLRQPDHDLSGKRTEGVTRLASF